MLLVYEKSTGKVLHHADCNGQVQPTLVGLYHACIKSNRPDLQIDDVGEYYSNDNVTDSDGISIREKIFTHDTITVIKDELVFENRNTLSPSTQNTTMHQRINDIESAIAAILGGGVA